MKKALTIVMLASIGCLAANNLSNLMVGAKVRKLSGSADFRSASQAWQPVTSTASLTPGCQIRLSPGAQLALLFRTDGHREELAGPCEVKLDSKACLLVKGAPDRIRRFDYRNQPMLAPRGNNQTTGGKMENTQATVGGAAPITSPTPNKNARVQPVRPLPTRRPDHASTAVQIPSPQVCPPPPPPPPPITIAAAEPAPLQVVFQDNSWQVLSGPAFESEVTVEDLESGTSVESRKLKPGQEWVLTDLSLQPGRQYRVRSEEGVTLAFRSLSPAEHQELEKLAQQPVGLARMDRYAELGLFHLAAQEGEQVLRSAAAPDPKLAQAVYDLYRYVLTDDGAADRFDTWAEEHSIELTH